MPKCIECQLLCHQRLLCLNIEDVPTYGYVFRETSIWIKNLTMDPLSLRIDFGFQDSVDIVCNVWVSVCVCLIVYWQNEFEIMNEVTIFGRNSGHISAKQPVVSISSGSKKSREIELNI